LVISVVGFSYVAAIKRSEFHWRYAPNAARRACQQGQSEHHSDEGKRGFLR
jgi:hypothetical protein